VNEFRRFLPRAGASGSGLIQFWGPKVSRTYRAGDQPGPWERVGDDDSLRTVEVSEIDRISDAKS
jgi:hypothetical protein